MIFHIRVNIHGGEGGEGARVCRVRQVKQNVIATDEDHVVARANVTSSKFHSREYFVS